MKQWHVRQIASLSLALTIGLLLVQGCDGDSGYQSVGVAQIGYSPEAIVFPATKTYDTAEVVVKLSSSGEKVLIISKLELQPDLPEFSIECNKFEQGELKEPFEIEPGIQYSFRVLYTPQEDTSNPSAQLIIGSNDSKFPDLAINISVGEFMPRLSREPALLKWESTVDPGQGPEAEDCDNPLNPKKYFKLRNTGSGELKITSYPLVLTQPAGETAAQHFTVCPPKTWNNYITSGTQEWWVLFHPDTPGEKRAELTIKSNGGDAAISLIGGGEAASRLEVTPMVVSWPELQQGQSGVKFVELINTGSLPVDVTLIKISPAEARTVYTKIEGPGYNPNTNRLDRPIAKNGAVRLGITYEASQPRPIDAVLEIHHSASLPPSPVQVSLMGNTTMPQLVVEPIPVMFAGTSPGSSDNRTLLVKNVGTATLEVAKIEIGPDGAALGHENFTCRPAPCAASLAPNSFRSFTIEYSRPLDAIQKEDRGCANVFSNDPNNQPSMCVGLQATNALGNLPPTACIESEPANPTVDVGTLITLSCACSTDPDEGQSIKSCTWLLVDWPASSRAGLSLLNGTPELPTTFTPDAAGTYRISLVVTDDSLTQFVSPERLVEIVAQ